MLSAHNYVIIMRSMCFLTEAVDHERYFKVGVKLRVMTNGGGIMEILRAKWGI